MPTRLTALALLAALAATPAAAQIGGGVGGGGVGGGVGGGTGSGVGTGTDLGGGVGGGTDGLGTGGTDGIGADGLDTSPGESLDPPSLDTLDSRIDGLSGPDASTESRATEGSGTVNPVNVDELSRSGEIGTSPVTEFGGLETGTPGGGSVGSPSSMREFGIPTPQLGVDLQAIRGVLGQRPVATPGPGGD